MKAIKDAGIENKGVMEERKATMRQLKRFGR